MALCGLTCPTNAPWTSASRFACWSSASTQPTLREGQSPVPPHRTLFAMSIESLLYDANGHDEAIEIGHVSLSQLGKQQLLWVDVGRDEDELDAVARALDLGDQLRTLPNVAARPRISRG